MFLGSLESPESLLFRAPKIIQNGWATMKSQRETWRHAKSLSRICVTLRTRCATILCVLGHLAECMPGGAWGRFCESLRVRNVDLGCLQWFSNGLRRFLRVFNTVHDIVYEFHMFKSFHTIPHSENAPPFNVWQAHLRLFPGNAISYKSHQNMTWRYATSGPGNTNLKLSAIAANGSAINK